MSGLLCGIFVGGLLVILFLFWLIRAIFRIPPPMT
jgi:uncharacterized protein HemY